MEIKPCPFCGYFLEKCHIKYKAVGGNIVEYDVYEHPSNGCILAGRLSDMDVLVEAEIEKWNERV